MSTIMQELQKRLFSRENESGMVRELVQSLLGTLNRQKDVLVDVLAKEIKVFLAKVNISDELKKALQGMKINLNASFDFEDKKEGDKKPRSRRKRR